jgi:hypothetical protein
MNPDLSHVRVTIVDLMGVFLPGAVWTLLLATLGKVLQSGGSTPVGVINSIFAGSAPRLGAGFYIAALITVLIVGYVAKYVAVKTAEYLVITYLVVPLARLRHRLKTGKPWTGKPSDFLFPYNAYHEGTPYFDKIVKAVESRLGIKRAEMASGQLFGTCKRLLKLHAPTLWEEAEQREAEVRMLASLVLAALFSLIVALLQATVHGNSTRAWALTSLASGIILVLAYRRRRRLEVVSVYFAVLAALPIIEAAVEKNGGLHSPRA